MKNRNFLIELFEHHWLYKGTSESIESHSVDEWKQLMCKHRKSLYDCDTLFVCVFSNSCYSHDFYNVLRSSVLRQTDWLRRVSDSSMWKVLRNEWNNLLQHNRCTCRSWNTCCWWNCRCWNNGCRHYCKKIKTRNKNLVLLYLFGKKQPVVYSGLH